MLEHETSSLNVLESRRSMSINSNTDTPRYHSIEVTGDGTKDCTQGLGMEMWQARQKNMCPSQPMQLYDRLSQM